MIHTVPYPFLPAADTYDEKRLRTRICTIEPLTPAIKMALRRVMDRQRELTLAYRQYLCDTALTGVPDYSRLKKIIPEFALARREALIALGEDPDTSDLMPAVPVVRQDP